MGKHRQRADDVFRPQQDDNKGTENDAGKSVARTGRFPPPSPTLHANPATASL